MIKIDVLLRAAEYLEHSERSFSSSSSSSLSSSSSSSSSSNDPIDTIDLPLINDRVSKREREAREKLLTKSEKAIHNTLEKNRRAHLKECFDQLQRELPAFKEKKKATNLSILNYTLKFIQQSQKKDKENELELARLVKKKDSLMNSLRKYVYELDTEPDDQFKSLVYEQIKNHHPAILLDSIEKEKSALKVKSPIEETSNEIDMICEVESGACSHHLGAKPESKMQNIENRNDIDGEGRSFVYSTQSSMVDQIDQDSSAAARLNGSISQNMLSDQIKNFDNIRIGLEAAAAAAATGGVVGFTPETALAAAHYANKLANLQILTSISSFMAVENK